MITVVGALVRIVLALASGHDPGLELGCGACISVTATECYCPEPDETPEDICRELARPGATWEDTCDALHIAYDAETDNAP